MSNPIVHWEIVGKDGGELRRFYGGVFGWEMNTMEGMDYAMVHPSERGIGGGIGAAAEGAGHATFYVEVEDTDACLAKIEEMGGHTVVPTTEIPDAVTFAMFTDPEGHLVGLVKAEG